MAGSVKMGRAVQTTSASQVCHPLAHSLSWIGPLLLKDHVLYAHEIFALRMVCRHAAWSECEHRYLRTWLPRRAPGLVFLSTRTSLGIRHLYQEYKGFLFQAEFLRSLSVAAPTALVTGSFPLAQHLQQHGLPAFQPNDIDIFTLDANDIDVIYHAYATHLTATFSSLRVAKAFSLTSNLEGCERSPHVYEYRHDELRSRIHEWVTWFARSSCYQSEAEVLELLLTCSNLPLQFQAPVFRVVESYVLNVSADDPKTYVPTSLLDVNLIAISITKPMPNPVSSLQHEACLNFDLKPCQISLQVDSQCLYYCIRTWKSIGLFIHMYCS